MKKLVVVVMLAALVVGSSGCSKTLGTENVHGGFKAQYIPPLGGHFELDLSLNPWGVFDGPPMGAVESLADLTLSPVSGVTLGVYAGYCSPLTVVGAVDMQLNPWEWFGEDEEDEGDTPPVE